MTSSIKSNIIFEFQDYMFTSKNIDRYTKHMIQFDVNEFINKTKQNNIKLVSKINTDIKPTIDVRNNININPSVHVTNDINIKPSVHVTNDINIKPSVHVTQNLRVNNNIYKPKQHDSLFWCFYILKHGLSNFQIMEINNKVFVTEKNEKFKYISLVRNNKDILKIHKIKPLTEVEDDLANKPKISVKTFFALCIIEKINILLVDKRKIYELLFTDEEPINIIYKNDNDFSIELDATSETIQKYRETYYKINNFEIGLKSMSSYKLDELIDLCKKLNINIEEYSNGKKTNKKEKIKLTKKDIYELLVLNY